MRTRKRGGYINSPVKPKQGNTVMKGETKYKITSVNDEMVTLENGETINNEELILVDEGTEGAVEASTEGTEGAVEASTEATEGAAEASTEGTEGAPEGAAEATEKKEGGKRRKTKRRKKTRKSKWDNKATVAVVATAVAIDKTSAPPTDAPEPMGGKKTKRNRRSTTRKKPRRLKKRVR